MLSDRLAQHPVNLILYFWLRCQGQHCSELHMWHRQAWWRGADGVQRDMYHDLGCGYLSWPAALLQQVCTAQAKCFSHGQARLGLCASCCERYRICVVYFPLVSASTSAFTSACSSSFLSPWSTVQCCMHGPCHHAMCYSMVQHLCISRL